MRFTFLGTSAGTPTKSRNVSGLALSFDQRAEWYLFDCGEGTQHRLLHLKLSLARLRRIFLSHLHGDHCFGLFGLLGSRSIQGATTPVTVYGPRGIRELTDTVYRITGQFSSFDLDIQEIETAGPVFESPHETVEAVALSHEVPCFAFVVREKSRPGRFRVQQAKALGIPEGPVFGRLKKGETVILENGRKIDGRTLVDPPVPGHTAVIAGDNDQPELLIPGLQNASVLIHEATYTDAVFQTIDRDVRHSTAKRVAQIAEAARLPNLILTHFSPRYLSPCSSTAAPTLEDICREAATFYPGRLFLAEDLATFTLNRDGSISCCGPKQK